jgi:hypothetical protein
MGHQNKDTAFHITGWMLFLACAFLFLYVAVRDGDIMLILASLVFFAGCVVFLIPLLFPAATPKNIPSSDRDGNPAKNNEKS